MEKPLLLTLVVCAGQNAGLKAPLDICKVLEQTGDVENAVFYTEKGKDFPVYLDIVDVVQRAVSMGRPIILQYPLQPVEYHERQKELSDLLGKMQPEKTVILIHDINHIRYPNVEIYRQEMDWLSRFRYFIVHNGLMEQYLKKFIPDCQCIRLELFDYLCTNVRKDRKCLDQAGMVPQIVFAGSLSKQKAPFLYQLDSNKMRFDINLYGKRVSTTANARIRYLGCAEAAMLPERLMGDVGLIWDGQIDALSDRSAQRQYNRINTPHKLSCYLAAGLPVAAWEGSAISEVIERYQIGYLIQNLYDLNALDVARYEYYKKNVEQLSIKVRKGYFTLKMWEQVKDTLPLKHMTEVQ